MTKKRFLVPLIALLLFFGLLIGGFAERGRRADLYYPLDPYLGAAESAHTYEIFKEHFDLVQAMDLFPNGNCGAGKGDVIALKFGMYLEGGEFVSTEAAMTVLAEKLAGQASGVLVFSSGDDFYGTYYTLRGGQLRRAYLYEHSSYAFSKAVSAQLSRPIATVYFAAAALALAVALGSALLIAGRGRGAERSLGESERAIRRLPRGKYLVSLAAAGFLTLGTLAWLIAPNLSMLAEGRFQSGVFLASVVSLPFLALAVLGVLNLTSFPKYRRWLNILCLVLAALALAILLFSLVMMALQN